MTKDEELNEAREWLERISDEHIFSDNPKSIQELLVAYHHHRLDKAWVSVKDRLPKALQPVLAIVKDQYGESRVLVEYVPPKTVLAEDFVNEESGDGLDEYDEEKDCYWTKEGWFEWQREAEIHFLICGDVTHWQHLPNPSKEV